ncbi:MAG: type VII secretion protein EssB/YukC [Lachnospiraceae bacterium]|nr:type VII secretion protein EssB/YukC [Lachnospiraceae bacterium]
MEERKEVIVESVKKSELRAKDKYDFNRLVTAGEHFLPMEWKAEEEIVLFTYSREGLTPFIEIRKEELVTILNLLIRIAAYEKDAVRYSFSMKPDNIFYDTTGKIQIKRRDILEETKDVNKVFLTEYKALIACALAGQYKFQDYMEGGDELLKKNRKTAPMLELNSVEAVKKFLQETRDVFIQDQKRKKISVSRVGNRFFKIATVILFVTTAAFGAYAGIQYFEKIPHLTAVNEANNAYIENNTEAVIEALRSTDVTELDKHQKYILTKAYLQSENLSSEQKTNIQNKLTLSSSEKELTYWIVLGRLDVKQAENIAMQLSDDELLLYAYMKDKDQVESDSTLDGTEKESQLSELQSKIDTLSEKYNQEETDTTTNAAPGTTPGAQDAVTE